MNEHEVYPNAPVVLVTLEVRHPAADPLSPTETRSIKKLLGGDFPLERTGMLTNVQVNGPGNAPEIETERFPRFVNRESTLSVSVRRQATVIEASRYPGWERFLELASKALDARTQIAPLDGVERIGLRYINEVRVPSDEEPEWATWFDESLLGPKEQKGIDLPISQWQGIAVYGSQPGRSLVLRHGPQVGFAVDPGSELKRARPVEAGPFFLLDVDSFWTPDGPIPEWDAATVHSTCNELHTPVRTLFEGLISDRLRDEVLRND